MKDKIFKKKVLSVSIIIICLLFSVYGCGSSNQTANPVDTSSVESQQNKKVDTDEGCVIDYGDAESFEAALNEGKNLEGKIVQFVAGGLKANSEFGYDVMAGEKLNFVSSRNPDIQEKDTVTVRATTIENIKGSWVINYEKVDNARTGKDTITYSGADETVESTATDSKVQETETEQEAASTESATIEEPVEETATEQPENTYENNEYYDVIEAASYQSSIGYTYVIHKVMAKKDVTISATMLAKGPEGNVLGKSTDEIILTAGQANYFRYMFEGDMSNASTELSAYPKGDSFMSGERNAVEMVQYDISGNSLYVTFRQTADNLEMFAKFKLLLYRGETIVGSADGYFNVYAENLNGKDSTDVAEVPVYGVEFDRVEYIFEP